MQRMPQPMKQTSQPLASLRSAPSTSIKLLIPIDATERSRWAIEYVLAQHARGAQLEVDLLFVAEPITDWRVLRFRTQAEIAKFQHQRGQWLLEDAARPLQQAGIPVRTHYREGDIAFEILDAAEQLACDRIVLPQPNPRWLSLIDRDIVRDVLKRTATVPVVTVGRRGAADPLAQSESGPRGAMPNAQS
jgi:nucleotide-binding universal stress UspA family protein